MTTYKVIFVLPTWPTSIKCESNLQEYSNSVTTTINEHSTKTIIDANGKRRGVITFILNTKTKDRYTSKSHGRVFIRQIIAKVPGTIGLLELENALYKYKSHFVLEKLESLDTYLRTI
jgi:hypothetical protein